MALYEITPDRLNPIGLTTFGDSGLYERGDLQRLLRKQIDVILPDILVVGEEFGDWDESRRRIDLLGVDRDANLVVIELKRTEEGGHMELQAIRYAAMVSTMTFEKVVGVYEHFLRSIGEHDTDASDLLLQFLGWDSPNDDVFGQDVKIVLISSNFSKELTTAVIWLNERNLDISCVRIIPYRDGQRTLLDVQQIIPLPEAADYQIRIKEKAQLERKAKAERHDVRLKFWQQFLANGAGRVPFHEKLRESDRGHIGFASGIKGITYYYVIAQFRWRVELYIDVGEKELNKRVFEWFAERRVAIEAEFGSALSWERLEDSRGSRIAFRDEQGGYRKDEAEWLAIQEEMMNAMSRLEKTLAPYAREAVSIL